MKLTVLTWISPKIKKTPVALAIALVVTSLLYLPGLRGDFIFDDLHDANIIDNPNLRIQTLSWESLSAAAFNNPEGRFNVHSRPVARLSFMLNYLYADGLDPYHFKLVNLLLHLLTAWVIFLLMRQVAVAARQVGHDIYHPLKPDQDAWVALLVATLWLLHPLNVSTVVYAVQRMAQLSALFTLLGVYAYVQCRVAFLENKPTRAYVMLFIGLFACWPLGILSKENAILLPLLCLIVEFALYQFRAIPNVLLKLHQLLILLVLGGMFYLLYDPAFIVNSYQHRDFTVWERLMTQSRVLWMYLHSLLLPDIGRMGLFLDDYPLSIGLLTPVTTLGSILAWLLAVLLAINFRRRFPLLSFALLWFLGAHLIESTIIGLEMAFEHRNYIPGIGVMAGISWGALALYQRYPKLQGIHRTAGATLLILLATLTLLRNHQWSDTLRHLHIETMNHPRSYRAHSELAAALIRAGRADEAQAVLEKITGTERPYANHYIIMLLAKKLADQKVSEAFYREAEEALASQRVYTVIIDQIITCFRYLHDHNRLDVPEAIDLTKALLHNPFLQMPRAQYNLNAILEELHTLTLQKSLPADAQIP